MFNVAWAKYEEGTEVVFYAGTKTENEKFTANADGTISPLAGPELVVGMQPTSLHHDKKTYDCDEQ